MDEFFRFLSNNTIAAGVLVAIISLAAISLISIVLIAFFQNRELVFWPPKIGPKPHSASSSSPEPILVIEKVAAVPERKNDTEKQLDVVRNEVSDYKRILRYIVALHATPFVSNYLIVTYTIDPQGGAHTREELSIVPISGKVYFRKMVLGVPANYSAPMELKTITAKNKGSTGDLEIVELSKDSKRVEAVIVLDPPAEPHKPVELVIESKRTAVFSSLVTALYEHGVWHMGQTRPALVEMRFIAPTQLEFTSISISPSEGECVIEDEGNMSCAFWKAESPKASEYTYVLRAKRRDKTRARR